MKMFMLEITYSNRPATRPIAIRSLSHEIYTSNTPGVTLFDYIIVVRYR